MVGCWGNNTIVSVNILSSRFYTGSNQERKGPISRTYLLNLFWEGKITFTTLVWCRAMDRYAQLQDVPMLVDFFHKTKPLPEIPERIAKEMKRCT
mmetsp:Transcript_10722/g.20565  ORF Transcript_10722/g.20565 Transcript_10722/m.20565 type:complete len:95 (+) Transcript_10722:1132-1416(+)